MKRLSQYFFRGLVTILPLGLTAYVLYVFLNWSETLAMRAIRPFVGDFYLPGMGLVLGVLAIVLLGVIVSQSFMTRLLVLVELPFTNLPVVKSIYSSLKSFADYFSPNHEQSPQQVVALRLPGHALEIVGMVTRQSMAGLPDGLMHGDRVAVYLPMGYMIGGYTVFVPRDWVTPIAMSVEEAMRQSLIAWMALGGQGGGQVGLQGHNAATTAANTAAAAAKADPAADPVPAPSPAPQLSPSAEPKP